MSTDLDQDSVVSGIAIDGACLQSTRKSVRSAELKLIVDSFSKNVSDLTCLLTLIEFLTFMAIVPRIAGRLIRQVLNGIGYRECGLHPESLQERDEIQRIAV